mgnify:CR=1 FL=1
MFAKSTYSAPITQMSPQPAAPTTSENGMHCWGFLFFNMVRQKEISYQTSSFSCFDSSNKCYLCFFFLSCWPFWKCTFRVDCIHCHLTLQKVTICLLLLTAHWTELICGKCSKSFHDVIDIWPWIYIIYRYRLIIIRCIIEYIIQDLFLVFLFFYLLSASPAKPAPTQPETGMVDVSIQLKI